MTPRSHTSDDDLAFWLKNKGEFSEQPWLNFLLELRDCRAANAEALDLVRRLREALLFNITAIEDLQTGKAATWFSRDCVALVKSAAWIAAREAATQEELK